MTQIASPESDRPNAFARTLIDPTDDTLSSVQESPVVRYEVRPGAYHDSIVLLQLQAGLLKLEGVSEAGAVMAAPENLETLRDQSLQPADLGAVSAEDLLVVVRAESVERATDALNQIDRLLERPASELSDDIAPRSLAGALRRLPEARWVLVSVPGRYAAGVAREALDLGRHVFLFSDNVAEQEEVALKTTAAERGLLVLGPDCGTASVGGFGLGFANRVGRGPVGLVGASGTGLQVVSTLLDRSGVGVSAMLGTGGHDLSATVGGTTTLQAIHLLGRDPECQVIVVVSKPPAPEIARRIAAAALETGKPTVLCLLGHSWSARRLGNLHFAASLTDATETAISLSREPTQVSSHTSFEQPRSTPGYVRGLFSGGTLALEALLVLRQFVPDLHSNLELPGVTPLSSPAESTRHTILDLGDDQFTRGRPHPMIDPEAGIARLLEEASDPEAGLLVLDLVLGDGAHADPAAQIAPAIDKALARRKSSAPLEVYVLVIGSEADPQHLDAQVEALSSAGARLFHDPSLLWQSLVSRLCTGHDQPPRAVSLEALQSPLAAINVGLASFAASLEAQSARVLHVDWRPPAGGNERLMSILSKMKSK